MKNCVEAKLKVLLSEKHISSMMNNPKNITIHCVHSGRGLDKTTLGGAGAVPAGDHDGAPSQ